MLRKLSKERGRDGTVKECLTGRISVFNRWRRLVIKAHLEMVYEFFCLSHFISLLFVVDSLQVVL